MAEKVSKKEENNTKTRPQLQGNTQKSSSNDSIQTLNYGRIKILTDYVINGNIENDKNNIPLILDEALTQHLINVNQYNINKNWYYNNASAILTKVKHIRPEIDNQFTFNTPRSTVKMNNGYCFGEPFKYICNEAEIEKQKEVQAFNKCLNLAKNHYHTLVCARNSAIYGISYKLALPPTKNDLKSNKFFNIVSDIDNNNTFIVYQNDIEKKPLMAVIFYDKNEYDENKNKKQVRIFNIWTKYHQWLFKLDNGVYTNSTYDININNVITTLDAYPLNIDINGKNHPTLLPLQEYERSEDRVGDFELSIQLMNAINILACCRVDSVQQSSDFIIKLRDIDVGTFDENGKNETLDLIKQYMQQHILAVESRDGATVQPDIDVLDIPLNQSEVQELQNFLWDMLLRELQQPTRTGGTGQDTGVAVENRNGFRELENNAVSITDSTINGERDFIEKLILIGQNQPNCPFPNISVDDITIQSMRNRSENLTTSTNNYREMRKAGVNPYTAYARSGLVADINDTVDLDNQWKQKEYDFILEQDIKRANAMKNINDKENVDTNSKNQEKEDTK